MAKKGEGGFRLVLGDDLQAKLVDFCVAHFDASQTSVIRKALEKFIDDQLAEEPATKERYDAARRKRLGI